MASQDVWSEFETLRHNVRHNTVDRLKQIVAGLNAECGTHIAKTGKKQEIIDKICVVLDNWKQQNAVEKWNKAKVIVYQVRSSGSYTPGMPSSSTTASTSSISSSYPSTSYTKAPSYTPATNAARYESYRKPSTYSPSTSTSVPKPPGTSKSALRFKDSPFLKIEQSVSSVIECPETTSASDRRQQSLQFTLSSEQLENLKMPNSKFQLRLFCTSSQYYSPSGVYQFNTPCPIEFPPTCEVRVNGVTLSANLKGLKKKPGTAPPPDLGKHVRLSSVGQQNRIEMVYVNSQQPTTPKKFYLVVNLVEITTVDFLVDNLKRTRFKSSNEIKQQMQAQLSEDDEIVAGPQKLSLKCPLSFMRINTPCRSEKCVHAQCFDATSWFSVMEQTTTYLCPVCNQTLNWNDLIIDGCFDEILKVCPDSVDDVMVEADGEWHTIDNKYGSANWKIKHPPTSSKPTTLPKLATPVKAESHEPSLYLSKAEDPPKRPNNVQIMVLDSDDEEEEGTVTRQLAPSYRNGVSSSTSQSQLSQPPKQSQDDVIDLTADSDDEQTQSPPMQNGKRKASDAALSPTETIWKKGRTEKSTGDDAYTNPRSSDHRTSTHTTDPLYSSYVGQSLPAATYYDSSRNSTSGGSLSNGHASYSSRNGSTASTSHWR